MYTHEQARRELNSFLAKSQKSQKQAAREMKLSSAVVSQFLNSAYPGNNDEVAKVIEQYLVIANMRLGIADKTPFVPDLFNTKEVLFACHYAHIHNDMALVSGDAGAGKTAALTDYAERNTNVIMVTANACTKSATEVLKLVAEKVLRQVPGRKAAIMQLLVEKLSDTNCLLIIDEADHLSLEALQAVRNLNDLAKIGIVLAGNDKIYRQMKSPRRGYEFDQIRSRFGVRKKVYNEFTVEEMAALFPAMDNRSLAFLQKLISTESLRTAKKLYRLAAEYADELGQPMGIKHLESTLKELFGVVL